MQATDVATRQRQYNFSAGPAVLPESVLMEVRDELPAYGDAGASIMEISHRSKAYDEAEEEYQRMFGEELDRMRRESLDDLQRARSFAHALRFVLPSYWIPGDQDWGAY